MTEVVQSMNCPNCGAPLRLQAGEIIVTCAYCGTATNLRADKKFFLAHSLIPARYSQGDIERYVREWMGTGFLKPVNLASRSRIESQTLSYLPFFVISLDAETKFSGLLKRTGTPERKSDAIKKSYEWKVLARKSQDFPTSEYDIPLQGKETFDLGKIQKEGRFLNAELDEEEAFAMAKGEIENIHRALASEYVDDIFEMKTDFKLNNTEFLHVPVWDVRYNYGNKSYDVLVDGATGKIVRGEFPAKKEEEKSMVLVYIVAAIIILLGLLLLIF